MSMNVSEIKQDDVLAALQQVGGYASTVMPVRFLKAIEDMGLVVVSKEAADGMNEALKEAVEWNWMDAENIPKGILEKIADNQDAFFVSIRQLHGDKQ